MHDIGQIVVVTAGQIVVVTAGKRITMPDQATQPNRTVKTPGPDHPITIERNPNRIVVTAGGLPIADTRHALTLREASYPPVQYIPMADVDMALLRRTDHATYCPYKGDCSYYSIEAGGAPLANAVWAYDAPYPSVAAIKGHVAFYAGRVEMTEQRPQ